MRILYSNTAPFRLPLSVQTFSFDPSDKHANVTLSNANKTASTTTGSAHYHAITNKFKSSGTWQFEMIVDAVTSGIGNISIGMDNNTSGNDNSYPGFPYSAGLWTRQSAAASRFYNGSALSTYDSLSAIPANILASGDIFGLTVDFATETISVYKNGTLVYSKVVTALNAPSYTYAPAIKIWGGAGNPTTISIPPSLTYPVSGFSIWN